MSEISELLAFPRAKGPAPTFDRAHLILALVTIGDKGVIGRQALARESGLGEGAVRTVLKKLREQDYADTKASGCFLTASGARAYRSLRKMLSLATSLEASGLTVGRQQVCLAVRGRAKMVATGIQQRDSAIRSGAAGATTYIISGGKFTIPGGSGDCEKDFPNPAWRRIRRELTPRNGDAVIVSGSDDAVKAKIGAVAAALTLL